MKKIKVLLSMLLFFAFVININAAVVKNTETSKIDAIFIGDSYCTADNYDNNGGSNDAIDHGWAIKTKTKLSIQNAFIGCQSGSGFIQEASGKTFFTLLREAKNSSAVTNKNVKLIVVAGGWNDHKAIEDSSAGQTQLVNSINSFIDEARGYFANAQIVISMVSWKQGNGSELTAILNKLQNRVETAYVQAANAKGILLIENGKNAIKDKPSMFSNDDLHPNEDGQNAIADMIADYVRENSVFIKYNEESPKSYVFITGKGGAFRNATASDKVFEGWATTQNGNVLYHADDPITDTIIKGNGTINLYPIFENDNEPDPTPTTYTLNVPEDEHITIAITNPKENYQEGDTVNFTVSPIEGYTITSVKIYTGQGANETEVNCTYENGTGSFIMPGGNVRIVVLYSEVIDPGTGGDSTPDIDVPPTLKYKDRTKNSVSLSFYVEGAGADVTCNVYRAEGDNGTYIFIGPFGCNTNNYVVDEGLEENKDYYYKAVVTGGVRYSNVLKVPAYSDENPDTGLKSYVVFFILLLVTSAITFIASLPKKRLVNSI